MMAKFRTSKVIDLQMPPAAVAPTADEQNQLLDRPIGEILRERARLSAEQVESVLQHMEEHQVRFGDAAVALGFVSQDEVLQALSEQFGYPYANEDRRKLSPELVALNQPFSSQAEAFRAIRSQVMMRVFNEEQQKRALAVVSPASGDGKTFFSANLAITLAQAGGRTLLVDADLRGPRLHEVFNLQNTAGLSSVLAGRVDSHVVQQVMGVPSLFVMPVGVTPPNPLELIDRPAFSMLIRELVLKFDHVIVDTPAVIYGSDAQVIAARCGAVLIVARQHESRVGALQKLVTALSESPARMAGVIMNQY
jgi:chain length determinant protein tyrosine kinase EpsG